MSAAIDAETRHDDQSLHRSRTMTEGGYAAFPTAPPGTTEYDEQLAAYVAYNESNEHESERDTTDDHALGDDDMSNEDDDRGFTYTAKFTLPGDAEQGREKPRTFKVRGLKGMSKDDATKRGTDALMEAHPDAQLVSEKCNKPRGSGFKKGNDERRNTQGNGGGGSQGEGSEEGDMRDSGGSGGSKGEQKSAEGSEGEGDGEQGDGEQDSDNEQEQKETPPDLMLMRLNAEPLIGDAANERISDLAHNVVTEALAGFDPKDATLDEEALAETIMKAVTPIIVKDVLAKMETQGTRKLRVEFKGDEREVKGFTHAEFAEVMETVALKMNVMLFGPSGSGKGVLARQVAESLGMRFSFISCSGGMSESQFLGRAMPNMKTGGMNYIRSEFIDFYENGGVYLIDEFDAINENVAIVLNEPLNSDQCAVPNREENPVAYRHADFVCIVAGNTAGSGATMAYTGRNRLDGATLDRFVGSTFIVDYDERVERQIAESYLEGPAAKQLLIDFWAIRNKIKSLKMQRIWGTRTLDRIAMKMQAGKTWDECTARCTIAWTEDERRKVGIRA